MSDTDKPGVPADIYLMLGEIRGDVKSLLNSQASQKADQEKLSERVTALEHGMTRIMAIATVGAAVLSFFAAKIQTILFGHS